jgi:hypothetical protein
MQKPVLDYLGSLPDSEVMEPIAAGLLLNDLRRIKGFPEATVADIYRDRSRRRQRLLKESQFQHELVKMATPLGIEANVLTSAYWVSRTQSEPGISALQAIAERSGLDLSTLTSAYLEVHPKEEVAKRKPQNPKGKPTSSKRPRRPPIPEEEVQEMRRRYLAGDKVSDIARSVDRDSKLVSLIVSYRRHENRPYLGLGLLTPRKQGYSREELLEMVKNSNIST